MNSIQIALADAGIARAVAEEVDGTGVAANGKVIFEGVIMERSEVAKIVDEREIAARKSSLFDVQDKIQDVVVANHARLVLRRNILWSINARIIGALRDVVFGMRESSLQGGGIDSWNDWLADLADSEVNAEYAEGLGYAQYGSGMNKVRALISVAQAWYDAADRDARATRTKLDAPSILEMMSMPTPFDQSVADKMALAVRLQMEDDSTEEEILAAEKFAVDKCKQDHLDRQALNKELGPILEKLYVQAKSTAREAVEFWQLPYDQQAGLIEAVVRSAKKLPVQLAKMRGVDLVEMALAVPQLKKLEKALLVTLQDNRFNV